MEEIEAERNYLSYNFQESLEWQDYLKTLYPLPNYDKMDIFKRKWFRSKINPKISLTPVNLVEANRTQDYQNTNQTTFQKKDIDSYTYLLGITSSTLHLFA